MRLLIFRKYNSQRASCAQYVNSDIDTHNPGEVKFTSDFDNDRFSSVTGFLCRSDGAQISPPGLLDICTVRTVRDEKTSVLRGHKIRNTTQSVAVVSCLDSLHPSSIFLLYLFLDVRFPVVFLPNYECMERTRVFSTRLIQHQYANLGLMCWCCGAYTRISLSVE